MTQVVYPSASFSANGAVALVDPDLVDRGLRVHDLPSGRLRRDLANEGDLALACLSASGNAVAWLTEDGRVAVLSDAGRLTVDLPAAPARVRALAVADTGERVAALLAGEGDDAPSERAGRLVVVPTRPGKEAPVAAAMPAYDIGFVLANDDCSLLAAESSSRIGEERSSAVFALDGGALRPLRPEQPAPAAHGALALYGEWVFAATADGLTGRRRTGDAVTLPGTMREQMIFSPDGGHLLAYRVEEVIEVTSARTLFRLIDLASLAEVRRAIHLVADRRDVQFALDAGLDLLDVRVTREAELVVNRLGWEGA